LLQNCSSPAKIPNSDIEVKGDYALKKLSPPEGKALIYIIRPPKYNAAVADFRVEIGQFVIGSTQAKRFLYTFVKPGKHILSGKAGNLSELPIEVQAGKTYFVKQKVKSGWIRVNNELILLEESEGEKLLKKCKLSGDNYTMRGL